MASHPRRCVCALLVAPVLVAAQPAAATSTVVRMTTDLGSFDIRLYDEAMPNSVANFLSYVNTDRYDGSFIHREGRRQDGSDFVIQGGGFVYRPDFNAIFGLPLDSPIDDEPGGGVAGISNLRGTISFAKSGPNTVTSQWFINVADNSDLDSPFRSDGGFAAFGRVLGDGMDVVDAINALPITDLGGGAFTTVPVQGAAGDPLEDRLVLTPEVAVLTTFPDGDYNFDGTVDDDDLAIWEADFGSTTRAEADGNGNGIVDAADFAIWRDNMGTTASAAAGVPEPTTWALGLLGAGLLALRRLAR